MGIQAWVAVCHHQGSAVAYGATYGLGYDRNAQFVVADPLIPLVAEYQAIRLVL